MASSLQKTPWWEEYEVFCKAWNLNHSDPTVAPNSTELTTVSAWELTTLDINATNDTDWDAIFAETRDTTQETVIPFMANAGIALNIATLLILRLDVHLRKTTHFILGNFLVFECLYLAVLEAMLRLRDSTFLHLDSIAYICLSCSVLQFIWIWLFYLLSDEAYCAVAQYYNLRKSYNMCDVVGYIILISICGLVFHVPFVPHIRILLSGLDPKFNPCVLPVFNLWDGRWDTSLTGDLYYVLYYYFAFVFLAHALPCFMVGCRIKDIVDILHATKGETGATYHMKHVANTAMFVVVMCNTNLVFHFTKLLSLSFGLANHGLGYAAQEYDAFRYFNVIGNFLYIFWTFTTFPIILHYNPRLNWLVCTVPCLRFQRVFRAYMRRVCGRARPLVKSLREKANLRGRPESAL